MLRAGRIRVFNRVEPRRLSSFSSTPYNLSQKPADQTEECPTTSDIDRRYSQSILPLYNRPPLALYRGHGSYVYDTSDVCYLDFTSGIAVNALGHAHPLVVAALQQQADKLIHTSNLFHTIPPIKLAEKLLMSLQNHTGSESWGDGKVFFSNSGTESIEAAIKFARKFGGAAGDKRHKILSFANGFHGRSMGSLSATPTVKYQEPFAPMLPGFRYAQLNNIDSVIEKMDDETCAVLIEPIQGEGGILPANADFMEQLRQVCDDYNALIISDEIQCGLGRTGEMWAHKAYPGFTPDIITLAKPLANGLPIGATIVNKKVAECLKPGDHGSTFGGNPLVAAVAIQVLQVIDQPFFLRRIKKLGDLLMNKLLDLKQQFPEIIADVRGKGLMLGIEMKKPGLNDKLVAECRDKRLLILSAGNNTVRLLPTLIIDVEEVEKAYEIIAASLVNISSKEASSE